MSECPTNSDCQWSEERNLICDAATEEALAGGPWREKYYEQLKQFAIQPEEIVEHLEATKRYIGIHGSLRRMIDEFIHSLIGRVDDQSKRSRHFVREPRNPTAQQFQNVHTDPNIANPN